MKFDYNLSYNVLPSYFKHYSDVINEGLPCQYQLRHAARPLIRPPKTRLVFAEASTLFQLIKLLNYTNNKYPDILKKN